MKNLRTYEQFVNESIDNTLNEGKVPGTLHTELKSYTKSELTPKALANVPNLNKGSLKTFTDSTYTLGKDTLYLYGIYSGSRNTSFIESIITSGFSSNNSVYLQLNNQDGVPLLLYIRLFKDVKEPEIREGYSLHSIDMYLPLMKLQAYYTLNGEDIMKAFQELLTQAIDKLQNELQERLDTLKKQLKAYVLPIGVVNIPSGATMYDWSIYDYPSSYVYLSDAMGGHLLYASKDSFEIGDKVRLFGNDNNRDLGKTGTILDMSPCVKEDVISMLLKHDYDYRAARPFQAKSSKRKLSTSYSVKGTEYLYSK
jgi:hypothetical protein